MHNNKLPISCYMITLNEADRVAIPINSVRDWVDEVIVIDSGSSDDTVAVCEALGARVIFNAWPGYGFQKHFAEAQCKNRWLLNIDADEEMTPAIIAEIGELFAKGEPAISGCMFQIRDLLPGEKKLAWLAHTDFRIRLYDRTKGTVDANIGYDPVVIESGEVVLLKGPVLHRSFRSLSHMLAKFNSFSDVQQKMLIEKGMRYPYLRLMIEGPFAFFKCYILRAYILRGWRGFIFARIYAYGRFVRIAKYIEALQKN